jgi:hypothetical protein
MFKRAMLVGLGAMLPLVIHYMVGRNKPASPTAVSPPAATAASIPGGAATTGAPLPGASEPAPASCSSDGTPICALAEVLRFDLTPDGITRRWPRVSTGLGQLQLQGYRVTLVTGTTPTDLAGALTYYFTSQQRLQRITFHGTTGDASGLANFVMTQFHLTRRLANDPGLIIYEGVSPDNRPASALRVRATPVVKAADTFHRYDLELVLERPEE